MRYKPVVAQPYLCFCALLEMIIFSELNESPTQLEIAEHFGVNVPPSYTPNGINHFHFTDDPKLWGIRPSGEAIIRFFNQFGLPLFEEFFPASIFEDWTFEDMVEKLLRSHAHILCGLPADPKDSIASPGHAVAIVEIDTTRKLDRDMSVYDPGPISPGQHWIQGWRLFAAMKCHNNGMWVIRHL